MKPSIVLASKSKVGVALYGHLKVPVINSFPSILAFMWPDSWLWLPVAQRWPWWNGLWEASWAAERLLKPPGPSRHSLHPLCDKVSALMPLGYYTPSAASIKNRAHFIVYRVQCLVTPISSWMVPFHPSSHGGGEAQQVSGNSHNLMDYEDLSSWPSYFPKALPANTITLRLEFLYDHIHPNYLGSSHTRLLSLSLFPDAGLPEVWVRPGYHSDVCTLGFCFKRHGIEMFA